MERLRELITILQEQLDRKADPAQMLQTTRLLDAELQRLASQPQPARVMPTKITVMMPSASKIYAGQQNGQPVADPRGESRAEPRKETANQRNINSNGSYPEQKPDPKKEPAPAPANPAPVNQTSAASQTPAASDVRAVTADARMADVHLSAAESRATPADPNSPDARYMPPVNPPATTSPAPTAGAAQEAPAAVPAAATATLEKSVDRGVWPFNPLADKPIDRFTLSQRAREVNDVIGLASTSLNDKLKSEVADLKSALNHTPVRDLKKAIGVNDRYVFINQLFRGDEVMYERSIKTINGFRILPEAEYWMERELKVKLGWDENRETTRHFYQLVKRRFS
jgi:hypothetical protein